MFSILALCLALLGEASPPAESLQIAASSYVLLADGRREPAPRVPCRLVLAWDGGERVLRSLDTGPEASARFAVPRPQTWDGKRDPVLRLEAFAPGLQRRVQELPPPWDGLLRVAVERRPGSSAVLHLPSDRPPDYGHFRVECHTSSAEDSTDPPEQRSRFDPRGSARLHFEPDETGRLRVLSLEGILLYEHPWAPDQGAVPPDLRLAKQWLQVDLLDAWGRPFGQQTCVTERWDENLQTWSIIPPAHGRLSSMAGRLHLYRQPPGRYRVRIHGLGRQGARLAEVHWRPGAGPQTARSPLVRVTQALKTPAGQPLYAKWRGRRFGSGPFEEGAVRVQWRQDGQLYASEPLVPSHDGYGAGVVRELEWLATPGVPTQVLLVLPDRMPIVQNVEVGLRPGPLPGDLIVPPCTRPARVEIVPQRGKAPVNEPLRITIERWPEGITFGVWDHDFRPKQPLHLLAVPPGRYRFRAWGPEGTEATDRPKPLAESELLVLGDSRHVLPLDLAD